MKRSLFVTSHAVNAPGRNPSWADVVPPAMKRRDARIWKMAYAAARGALNGTRDRQLKSIVVGTALGALEETRLFLDGVFTDGLGSPRSFIASVHNSMAGKLALEFKISGPNLTVCDSHNSFASALVAVDLLTDDDFPALLCIVDERISLLDELRPHLSPRCLPYLAEEWEEAAVAFVIDRRAAGGCCAVRACGPVPTDRRDPESICRELVEKHIPGFRGSFTFNESSTSFVRPAVAAAEAIRQGISHHVIGSFSPTSGAAAIVELRQTAR
jgi:hypothetical protein